MSHNSTLTSLFDKLISLYNRDEVEFLDNSEWLEPSGNKLQHAEGDEGRTIANKPGVFERSIVMKNDLACGEATLEMVPNISEFYYQRNRMVQCLCSNTNLSVTGDLHHHYYYHHRLLIQIIVFLKSTICTYSLHLFSGSYCLSVSLLPCPLSDSPVCPRCSSRPGEAGAHPAGRSLHGAHRHHPQEGPRAHHDALPELAQDGLRPGGNNNNNHHHHHHYSYTVTDIFTKPTITYRRCISSLYMYLFAYYNIQLRVGTT
jgi:hypothetical protein